jgi:hypothetical protein
MWANVERFLYSEGFSAEEVARILATAHERGLDAMLIERVLAASEGEVRLLNY